MAYRRALTISRNGVRGRPNRLAWGSSGSSSCHCASVTSVSYWAFCIARTALLRIVNRSSPSPKSSPPSLSYIIPFFIQALRPFIDRRLERAVIRLQASGRYLPQSLLWLTRGVLVFRYYSNSGFLSDSTFNKSRNELDSRKP